MPTLKPFNPAFFVGIAISTINANNKAIFFMQPPLGKRGNAMREAQKELKKVQENGLLENETREEFNERLKNAAIKVICESIKLQYYVDLTKEEKAQLENQDQDELLIDLLGNYFVDTDIQRILVSMNFGRELSNSEMYETFKDVEEEIPEKN